MDCSDSWTVLQRQDKQNPRLSLRDYSLKIKYAESASEALQILETMSRNGIPPNVVHFGAAISVCGKKGMWQAAVDLLHCMEQYGVLPNVVCYSAAITACGNSGKWEKALAFFDEIKTRGISPDVIIFTAAITACGNTGQWEKALELFNEMKKTRGIRPNAISYNAVFAACGNGGQWGKALQFHEEMKTSGIQYGERSANGAYVLDLHGLTLAVACMVVSKFLISFGCHRKDGVMDIIIVTGKGLRSDPSIGPVLRTRIRKFLVDNSGPETVDVADNEGRFLITKRALRKWLASKDFAKFKNKLMVAFGVP